VKINKGKQPGPRKILLYGEEGVGKSTFANGAPRTIFLDIEEGLRDIDCEKSDPLGTVGDVINANSSAFLKTVWIPANTMSAESLNRRSPAE